MPASRAFFDAIDANKRRQTNPEVWTWAQSPTRGLYILRQGNDEVGTVSLLPDKIVHEAVLLERPRGVDQHQIQVTQSDPTPGSVARPERRPPARRTWHDGTHGK